MSIIGKGYAVVARQYHGDVLRSLHGSHEFASTAICQTIDTNSLRIEKVEVSFSENGNIRMWKMVNKSVLSKNNLDMNIEFTIPSQKEIVKVLRDHSLIKLREKVTRAFLVGSFAKGCSRADSDVDILLEIKPKDGYSDLKLEDSYRHALRQYFVTHDISKMDSVHPQWCGRRVDLYLTYNADDETRPKILLSKSK